MEALHQNFKGTPFVLLAISVDYDEKKKVKEFIVNTVTPFQS